MIPVKDVDAEVVNTLGGEKLKMVLDEDSLEDLMVLLTTLYSDEEMACLREYSTNARDAQIENGKSDVPISVSLPTLMSPYLKIKDCGVGLSADDIRHMFRKYGKSTKKTIADQNGSMGLGAKCALAYTNQFTLISVKNGRKIHVSVSRNADGTGDMEIVNESATDEPSGTEVIIPAARTHGFARKAASLFRYWEKGTVLVDGRDPSCLDLLVKVTDRIYIDPSSYRNEDVVFMGGVPYPLRNKIGRLRQSTGHLVAFVSMDGEDQVKYTPSREGLIYNPRTEKVIEGLSKEYDDHILVNMQAEIDKAATHSDARKIANDKRNLFSGWRNTDVFTYKGEVIPEPNEKISVTIPPMMPDYWGGVWYFGRARHGCHTLDYMRWDQANWIIYNYPTTTPSADHKRKLKIYIETNFPSKRMGTLYFIKSDKQYINSSKWYTSEMLDWNEIRKMRVPRAGGSGEKSETWNAYDRKVGYHRDLQEDTLPKDKKVIYWTSAKDGDIGGAQYGVLTKVYPDAILIREPQNRHKRLVRTFPKAVALSEAWKDVKKTLESQLTQQDFQIEQASHLNYGEVAVLIAKHATRNGQKIADDKFIQYADAYQSRYGSTINGTMVYSQAWLDMRALGLFPTLPDGMKIESIDRSYFESNYPLLSCVQRYSIGIEQTNDLIDYINMKHKERTGA